MDDDDSEGLSKEKPMAAGAAKVETSDSKLKEKISQEKR